MTTEEAIADINVIIKDLSVMSDTDMITDEGIKTLKALQHLIYIAKRFEGAVEVYVETQVSQYGTDAITHDAKTYKQLYNHKLYAIPKTKENK